MAAAKSFRELKVYVLARESARFVFVATRSFPKEERYSLTDQIRRASRSIGANIAEAWQKRPYPAHFVSKLTDADGEQAETQHWLETALACDYIDKTEHRDLLAKCTRIGEMLGKMIAHPDQWCRKVE